MEHFKPKKYNLVKKRSSIIDEAENFELLIYRIWRKDIKSQESPILVNNNDESSLL